MNVQFSRISLATKILILLNLYSKNFYAKLNDNDTSKYGVRKGDLLFLLNKEENDRGLPPEKYTSNDDLTKCLNRLSSEGIIVPDNSTGMDIYYSVKKELFLPNPSSHTNSDEKTKI